MRWPPRGHFLPENILPGSRRERGFSLGRQEGPGVRCPLVSSGRALGDPRKDQLHSWMSEPLELKDLCPHPRPQAEFLEFPAWSALSFRGWDLRPQSRFSCPYAPWPEPMSPSLQMTGQRARSLWRGPTGSNLCLRAHPEPSSWVRADGPAPAAPALGPRRALAAQHPPHPQWPKYNLSRRLAGNRDLCQLPAGAGGRKVSMIGRGAGQAGSQTWVM